MTTKLPKKKTAAQADAFAGPPPRTAERKNKPSLEVVKPKNLQRQPSGVSVPIQLKITAEMRREFKRHAVDNDMTASDLFAMVWDKYKETNM